jgi:poly-gamma-glutamate synthesis protein (capsule biosynthesis protein)
VLSIWSLEADPSNPVPLVQARWLENLPAPLLPDTAWRPLLTGWQRTYLPAFGRELAWGCALAAQGSDPAGWKEVDATASETALLGENPSAPLTSLAPGASVTSEDSQAPSAGPAFLQTSSSVTIAWMGDVMLASRPGRLIAQGLDPFEKIASTLAKADLRIANLECVIAKGGRAEHKPWTFRAHPKALSVLKRHVDAVSLANNHSGDFGPKAFAQMLDRLEGAGIDYFGGGRDRRAAHEPRIIERGGLRIALLGYDEMFPRTFEASEGHPGVAWSEEEQVVADIQVARTRADLVIPFMHWGQEGSPLAHERQRALAQRMIAAGAAAVVGAHPHVRQDTEMIDGKPVIYSLGNFVFDGFEGSATHGSILWMTIDRTGVRQWHLQEVELDREGRPAPTGSVTPARH